MSKAYIPSIADIRSPFIRRVVLLFFTPFALALLITLNTVTSTVGVGGGIIIGIYRIAQGTLEAIYFAVNEIWWKNLWTFYQAFRISWAGEYVKSTK